MRKSMLLSLMACIAAFCLTANAGGNDKVKPFDSAKWQASFTDAYNKKDVKQVKKHLSRLYNVTGHSRDEAVKRLEGLFKNYDRVSLDYQVIQASLRPGTGHTVLKARSVLKGVRPGGNNFETIVEREGYDSLIFEEGRWKMFDTVAAARNINEGLAAYGADLFADCPPGAFAASFETEKGNWESWPVSAQGELGDRAVRVGVRPQALVFVPSAWESKVTTAWNNKSLNLVADLYSNLYSHAGASKQDVLSQTASLFNSFGNFTARYRVIDFRYLTDPKLVSVKAVIELYAEPIGGGTSSKIFGTMGYGSLVNENGVWRLYATQPYN